jgi:hypothetical protein
MMASKLRDTGFIDRESWSCTMMASKLRDTGFVDRESWSCCSLGTQLRCQAQREAVGDGVPPSRS